jgi:hypothetical protein
MSLLNLFSDKKNVAMKHLTQKKASASPPV